MTNINLKCTSKEACFSWWRRWSWSINNVWCTT